MNKEEILKALEDLKDSAYREFSIKLTKTKYLVYGIRIPNIKILAKKIVKSTYIEEILSSKSECYEYLFLQGFLIAYSKADVKIKLDWLKNFVLKIDDWAVCDCVACALKIKDEDFFKQCIEWTKSDKEFVCRFGIINLMSHFMDEEHVDDAIINISKIKWHYYYIDMAIAWFIQKLYFKFKDKAEAMLNDDKISEEIKKKARQKIRDSLRERK